MYKVAFKTAGKGKVTDMTLTYSVPREFARYVFKQDYRYCLFSWKNDRIEKEFNPLKNRECTLQWTTGIEKGFAFAPESNKNWANKPDAEDVSVILNSNDLAKLEEALLAQFKAKISAGVTLKANDNFDGGFRIAVNNGSAYYDYSTEAVVNMLSNYLNPKVTELLKEAK